MLNFLKQIEGIVSYIEKIMIVAILSVIIILSFSGIILRNTGISVPAWVSAVLQYSVFWVAFLGGSLASRKNRHVNINLFATLFATHRGLSRVLSILPNLFVVPVTLALFYGAYCFIKVEYDWGIDVPALGLPSWIFESIVVYTFIAISFKYFIRLLEALTGGPFPEQLEVKENT